MYWRWLWALGLLVVIGCSRGFTIESPYHSPQFASPTRVLVIVESPEYDPYNPTPNQVEPATYDHVLLDATTRRVVWKRALPSFSALVVGSGGNFAIVAELDRSTEPMAQGGRLSLLNLKDGALRPLDIWAKGEPYEGAGDHRVRAPSRYDVNGSATEIAHYSRGRLHIYDTATSELVFSSPPREKLWANAVLFDSSRPRLALASSDALDTVFEMAVFARGPEGWVPEAVFEAWRGSWTPRGLLVLTRQGIALYQDRKLEVILTAPGAWFMWPSKDGRYAVLAEGSIMRLVDLVQRKELARAERADQVGFRSDAAIVFHRNGNLSRFDLKTGKRDVLKRYGRQSTQQSIPFISGSNVNVHYEVDLGPGGQFLLYHEPASREHTLYRIDDL